MKNSNAKTATITRRSQLGFAITTAHINTERGLMADLPSQPNEWGTPRQIVEEMKSYDRLNCDYGVAIWVRGRPARILGSLGLNHLVNGKFYGISELTVEFLD